METMAAASGQRLNKDKTKLLLLGPRIRRRHPQWQQPQPTPEQLQQWPAAVGRLYRQVDADQRQQLQHEQLDLQSIPLQCVLAANILGITNTVTVGSSYATCTS